MHYYVKVYYTRLHAGPTPRSTHSIVTNTMPQGWLSGRVGPRSSIQYNVVLHTRARIRGLAIVSNIMLQDSRAQFINNTCGTAIVQSRTATAHGSLIDAAVVADILRTNIVLPRVLLDIFNIYRVLQLYQGMYITWSV